MDMGTFYSAARDPIFYPHHTNVDRLWTVWLKLPGRNRKVFEDEDWLNSSFIFWDENMQLVRVRVRDSLDTLNLGYIYQTVSLPWINYKPLHPIEDVEKLLPNKTIMFPVKLESVMSIEVKRPKALGSEDKEHKEEVLIVDDIELMRSECVKFDVYVNARTDLTKLSADSVHFAGTFVHLVHVAVGPEKMEKQMMKTKLLLGLSELLNDIEADRDESVLISIVPRKGAVSIGKVRIEMSS